MPTPSSAPTSPVVRLRTPGEVAAAVPRLCGFVPDDSLVVLSLRGGRSRLGLVLRVDLPPPEDAHALAAAVASRLSADGARAAAAVVWTAVPHHADGPPHAPLVDALGDRLARAGVELVERLLVRDGRWWSYGCSSPACCPASGTPLPGPRTPALALVDAHAALTGRAVLPSRAALVAQLAPTRDDVDLAQLAAAQAVRQARMDGEGRRAVARDALRAWRQALEAGPAAAPADAARLVVALQDVVVRDEVLGWALEDADALLALLLQLVGRAAPPHDVDLCAVLALVAHLRGDGALASVALDRALATRPGHGLATLGRQALDAQVAPEAMRALLTESRRVLRRRHPEAGGWADAQRERRPEAGGRPGVEQ